MDGKVRRILMAVFGITFVISSVAALRIVYEYHSADALYEESAAVYTREENKDGGPGEEDAIPISVDFAALQSVNEDIAAWIFCEGTDINYPVVQGEDNDFYLGHTYDKAVSRSGSIFVEALNAPGFADSNTLIYGHHMKNGSMFATLRNWSDQAYYEEHPMFWLLTPGQDYQVLLFSGYTTAATSDAYTVFRGPCREFDDYLQAALAESDFSADVEIDPAGRFVMLSTCEYSFQDARYVLHGMLVPYEGQ